MNNLINVNLYGDGSPSCRLRAEYVYCDYANECSAYKDGKCFCVTTPFNSKCKLGQVFGVDGGTKRAKSYNQVYNEAKANDKYGKLKYPTGAYIIRIGDKVRLELPYVNIDITEDGNLELNERPFGRGNASLIININKLTADNIKRICDHLPKSLVGSVYIKNYQEKTIPMFLHQLGKLLPDKLNEFKTKYKDYIIKPPSWIGEFAKLSTCNRDKTYCDIHDNEFFFDGDYIVCTNYRLSFAPFGAKETEIRVKVTDDMLVKITDNDQVIDGTIIV